MIDASATGPPRYERSRQEGIAALARGDLQGARAAFEESVRHARALGDADLADRALCNSAAVAISLGEAEAHVASLREVLMRSACNQNRFLAAYNISRAYELAKQPKKGLFYARLACERARLLERPERLAAALNQMANNLLADSAFGDAATAYRQALELLPSADEDRRLICQSNLGYCEVVLGRLRDGMRRLYGVLRAARRSGSLRHEMIARVDLCYANLELGALARAQRHGSRGLALAESIGEVDWVKNALYLLGEVAVLSGDSDGARSRFTALQQRFYPEQSYLPELLVGVDVRGMINLRA